MTLPCRSKASGNITPAVWRLRQYNFSDRLKIKKVKTICELPILSPVLWTSFVVEHSQWLGGLALLSLLVLLTRTGQVSFSTWLIAKKGHVQQGTTPIAHHQWPGLSSQVITFRLFSCLELNVDWSVSLLITAHVTMSNRSLLRQT